MKNPPPQAIVDLLNQLSPGLGLMPPRTTVISDGDDVQISVRKDAQGKLHYRYRLSGEVGFTEYQRFRIMQPVTVEDVE